LPLAAAHLVRVPAQVVGGSQTDVVQGPRRDRLAIALHVVDP
jgi:hypothetical protein